jgi:hypothetical protein
MGLTERRAQKEFVDSLFPALKAQIDKAAGFDVAVEVDWESLTVADYSHLYKECWPKVYFEPTVEALKAICVDDMGKDALKAKLKKIVIHNKHDISYGDRWASFDDGSGTVTLDHNPVSNIDDVKERKEGLQKLLESKL